jgi:hypothetical protein
MKHKVVKLASKMARRYEFLNNAGLDLMLRNMILPKLVFTDTYWKEMELGFIEL